MILNAVFLVTTALFTMSAQAETIQPLLDATSDVFRHECHLSIVLNDEGTATGFQYVAGGKTQVFPIEGLIKGVVLLRDSGLAIITLQGLGFDPASGGELQLKYLYNGISERYKSIPIAIERMGSDWDFLVDNQSGRHAVSKAYFKSNRVLGQVVGISEVIFNPATF